MRAKVLQIHWHQRKAVFSVDCEPVAPFKLATAGEDGAVRLWSTAATTDDNVPSASVVEFLADLCKHTASVNVVRWSPRGGIVASAGDDGNVLVWQQQSGSSGAQPAQTSSLFGASADSDPVDQREFWYTAQTLQGSSLASIYDLAWSPCGAFICVAANSSDRSSVGVWHVTSRTRLYELQDHSHFVHGVAWDPLSGHIVTQGSDRAVNVYSVVSKAEGKLDVRLMQKSSRMEYPPTKELLKSDVVVGREPMDVNYSTIGNASPASKDASTAECGTTNVAAVKPATQKSKQFMRLYHGETLMTFFRRLTFSPDGSMMIAPCGQYKAAAESDAEPINVAYVYARNRINCAPVMYVPTNRPSRIVRFCPIQFQLRDTASELSTAAYRYIFAVACRNAVTLYDTQSLQAFAYVGNMHYAPINDLAWSADGLKLFVASSDGFCSVICFDGVAELGVPVVVSTPHTLEKSVAAVV